VAADLPVASELDPQHHSYRISTLPMVPGLAPSTLDVLSSNCVM
jgi:hypothetical protein